MIAPIGALIFDMDGVLLDSGAWHRAAWDALLTELGESPARPDYWRLPTGRASGGGLAARRVPLPVGPSASSYDVDHLLRGIGLLHHFPVVVTADDVTYGKPNPEV